MLEIKLLIFTLIILFYYFPTMAFCSNGFDQRIQRKQAQPCINQMLTQLDRLSKLDAQLKFLFLCRNHGVMPKGLRSQIPKNIVQSNYGKRLQIRFDRKILATSISDIYIPRSIMLSKELQG